VERCLYDNVRGKQEIEHELPSENSISENVRKGWFRENQQENRFGEEIIIGGSADGVVTRGGGFMSRES